MSSLHIEGNYVTVFSLTTHLAVNGVYTSKVNSLVVSYFYVEESVRNMCEGSSYDIISLFTCDVLHVA